MAGGGKKRGVRESKATYGPTEVPASELKNDWHHWLDEVARGRREVLVTRYGKPIARLVPIESGTRGSLFGALRGWVEEEGDLVAPAGDDWEAQG